MKFLDWFLDRDNCRSHPALLTSMTGEALLRSGGGRSWYATEIGHTRIFVSYSMMLGNNAETAKKILKGEYDFCLTKEDKEKHTKEIIKALEKGGEFRYTVREKEGHLSFAKDHWSKSDLKEISKLLSKRY